MAYIGEVGRELKEFISLVPVILPSFSYDEIMGHIFTHDIPTGAASSLALFCGGLAGMLKVVVPALMCARRENAVIRLRDMIITYNTHNWCRSKTSPGTDGMPSVFINSVLTYSALSSL